MNQTQVSPLSYSKVGNSRPNQAPSSQEEVILIGIFGIFWFGEPLCIHPAMPLTDTLCDVAFLIGLRVWQQRGQLGPMMAGTGASKGAHNQSQAHILAAPQPTTMIHPVITPTPVMVYRHPSQSTSTTTITQYVQAKPTYRAVPNHGYPGSQHLCPPGEPYCIVQEWR